MNLAQVIERNARLFPDGAALSLGEGLYATHAQLARRVHALSYALRTIYKLAPGSRIGLAMTNSPAFWEVLFAAWHAGMAAVPVNPKLHSREIEFILAHSGASLCFVTPDLAGAIAPLADELTSLIEVFSTGGKKYQRLRDATVPDTDMVDAAPTDPAWLFYTSGTTGRPKGAMLSHRNLLMMIMAYLADIDLVDHGDCIVHGAPQSHGSGLWGLVHFARGANNIIPESGGFDPAELAVLLNRYAGLSMFAAPTMVNRLALSRDFVAANLGHLKMISYGGAPMYLPDIRRALDIFGPRFSQIYGQGESPMTITGLSRAFHADCDHPRFQDRLASVGLARTGVDVRVQDEKGRPLHPGEVGEVAVRGDVVMAGYWYDDAATQAALHNGWLRTGDIGSFDQDGFLTLLDRSKDMIISGGSNIYPREIEELLMIHPAVREVAVVGRPHAEWGEEVVAFVVCAPEQTIAQSDLDHLCLENIGRYKRPKAYIFVDALPKNSTGKVLKTELRKQATQI
jgi:acyl-CoA synthetase (AMP-forming)/AMP-acid ligase II